MSPCTEASCSRSWKGKARAVDPVDSSLFARDGGEDGSTVPLTLIQTTAYETVYTVPVQVSGQNLYLQVDTGSSDLWIASSSCTTQACKQAGGSLYDPSHSQPTGKTFTIDYVEGEVIGPIVWDTLIVGGYEIDDQAFAAATTVDDEPLSPNFIGILGLALPQNSVISSLIPPVTGNQPDGAVFASNLFSMTPSSTSPSARFLSLTLARPEANGAGVPSLLGVGKHPPSSVIADPSQVQYASLASPSASGPYFWQAQLDGISVWVNGVEKVVDVGTSATVPGGIPTAVVDSGMPIIFTSPAIANGIYGALGIGPGSDGQYYISCTTPINMTIVLDSRTSIPLHPLDLTTPSGGSSSTCLGLIQAYTPSSGISAIADVILGVPFMRSTYTVMAYDPPDSRGVFPNATSGSLGTSWSTIRPRLGLLGLVNPSVALDEFHTVRVLNEPLPSGSGGGNDGGSGGANQASGGNRQLTVDSGKKLSVGLEVLIGLLGFFALCFILFTVRWAVHKRKLARLNRERQLAHMRSDSEDSVKEDGEYMMQQQAAMNLVRRSTLSSRYGETLSTMKRRQESTLDVGRAEVQSEYTDDTARTRVGEVGEDGKIKEQEQEQDVSDRELGFRHSRSRSSGYEYVPFNEMGGEDTEPSADVDIITHTWIDDAAPTLVNARPRLSHASTPSTTEQHEDMALMQDNDHNERCSANFQQDFFLDSLEQSHTRVHTTDAGVAIPLLAHTRGELHDSLPLTHGPPQRTPLGLGRPQSRARVGSFGSHSSRQRTPSAVEVDRSSYFDEHGRRASGSVARDSMAGVGTFSARLSSMNLHQHQPPSPSIPLLPHLPSPLLPPPPSSGYILQNETSSQVSLSAEATNGHSSTS